MNHEYVDRPPWVSSKINILITGVLILTLFALCSRVSGTEGSTEESIDVRSRVKSMLNSDPIENGYVIIERYQRVRDYQDKDDARQYWSYIRDHLGWIIVYLGDNAPLSDEIIEFMDTVDEVFGSLQFPNTICFSDQHAEIAKRLAHQSPRVLLTFDRSVHGMVREALFRIRGRGEEELQQQEE